MGETSAYKSLDGITAADITALGIPADVADQLHHQLHRIISVSGAGTAETWRSISSSLLSPELPFSLHQMMYYGCYKNFGPDPPAWFPDPDGVYSTNVGKLLKEQGQQFLGSKYVDPISSFLDFQELSVSNPEVYWKTVFEKINVTFSNIPSSILREDPALPGGHWLPGAATNPARNCLDFSGNRIPEGIAVVWRDEGDDDAPVSKMTLKELRASVWCVAHALGNLNLEKGSAIAISMPMDVDSVVIYLAIVLGGYVVVSIADSFAPAEIAVRLRISNAKAIFTKDLIIRGDKKIPLYSRIIEAQSPRAVVIPTRGSHFSTGLRENDLSWQNFLKAVDGSKEVEFIAAEQSSDSLTNILFSSGTTGEPKAIPWTTLTPFKTAADGWCNMDIKEGDVVCWPTNLGWMMGPWLLYASLLNGASIALYNGSPLGSGFAKFVQDAKVTMLGVIPSIVRAWKSSNSVSHDWSSIRCFASTGEASNVDEYLWLMSRAKYKPVIEYCGGTEIGGAFVTGSLLQSQCIAAFSTPAMGCSLFILDENGSPLPQESPAVGELALYPLIFGASSTLLNANHYDVYFKKMPVWNGKVLRRHGDVFERTVKGYYRAHGRADDTMNIGGIKVSSVEIERVCNLANDAILETAAIGVPPPDGGPEQLVIAVVLKHPQSLPSNVKLVASFNSALQKKLNPLFKVSDVVLLQTLPRTATNKVMRRVLRQQFSQSCQYSKL